MGKQNVETRALDVGGERWTREQALRVIGAWATSGETVTKFARRHGVEPQRVGAWRRRLGVSAASAEKEVSTGARFVPVVVRGAELQASRPSVTVYVPGGLRVEVGALDGASAAWVATLARSLEGGGS